MANYEEVLRLFVITLRLAFLVCVNVVMFTILRSGREDRRSSSSKEVTDPESSARASRTQRLQRQSVVIFPLIMIVSVLIEKVPIPELRAALLLGFSLLLYVLWRRERLRLI